MKDRPIHLGDRRKCIAAMILLNCLLSHCRSSPTEPCSSPCAGPYPAQETSPYVLPYPVGSVYRVGQGNCSCGSHASGSAVAYAYDFQTPIGSEIVASREGEVVLLEERFEDGNRIAGQENYINILHADGSVAGYVHLTRGGVLVETGDRVLQGQTIGYSGDTGDSSAPHLHFHVQSCRGCPTLPVTFSNTRPHPRGLLEGELYEAER